MEENPGHQWSADDYAMWSSLLVYFAVWAYLPYRLMGEDYWYVSLVFAISYTAGMVRGILTEGHCYMSADPSALGLLLPALVVLVVVMNVFDLASGWGLWLDMLLSVGASLMVGHVLAIACGALVTAVAAAWLKP